MAAFYKGQMIHASAFINAAFVVLKTVLNLNLNHLLVPLFLIPLGSSDLVQDLVRNSWYWVSYIWDWALVTGSTREA